jgi:isoaspartyl peptidase/L-asparaginase-like protein (Ntn-hydrolase superfamily)
MIVSTWSFGLEANKAAKVMLDNGGTAMDAAEEGARITEADVTNNSVGIGGLPDEDGFVTLDSCVMDHTGNCGSVAFLQDILHPVSVARKVMEDTKHVMLVGEGAKKFALSKGFKKIKLLTEKSKKDWEAWQKERREMTPHETHDTISIIVQDKNGDLAGACTTSGWAYKMHGRVGDSPLIGAGLFVVVELMRQGYLPKEACQEALKRVIKKHNGNPDFQIGYVAMRKDGEVGAAALKWTFEYALSKNKSNKLYKINGMLPG